MRRAQAVWLMVLVTLLWSMAGVVTRQVEVAQGLTLTFWRSAFNAAALLLLLCWWRSPAALITALRTGGVALWASGCCWAVMFTAFMWALTLTTVANVLVTMALGPLLTAVLARFVLGQPLSRSTLAAVVLAGVGLLLMQGPSLQAAWAGQPPVQAPLVPTAHGEGIALAFLVPVAAAVNWVLIRAVAQRSASTARAAPDFLVSVLLGAVMSMVAAGMASEPLQVSPQDLTWLALLGVFQLAVPCLLAVVAARVLEPAEVALLSLLEVLFGVAWAWMGTQERPELAVVVGGGLVLLTLLLHEALQWRRGSEGQSQRC